MTSSTSCSSRRAFALAVLAAATVAGCGARLRNATGHPPPAAAGRARRVAVFPPENVSGSIAPLRELRAGIELALARAGVEVVSGELLERYLAKHRLRYTGGLDRAAARAAGEELGVDGVVITDLELYAAGPPPALGLTMRLVGTEDAALLWIDGAARTGDDAPGLLGLGVISDLRPLQDLLVTRLARSLTAYLDGRGPPAPPCCDGRRFLPRVPYRAPTLEARGRYTVAVVPFRNLTLRRGAGDLVALEVARQMAAVEPFQVLEPGVVRELLLRARIIMEGGVSLDQVRSIIGALGADLVVAGDVVEFGDGAIPGANFTFTVLDGRSGEIAWQSTSFNHGDDGVFFFDVGKVSTASTLTCRMIRAAVEGMFSQHPVPRPERPERRGLLGPR